MLSKTTITNDSNDYFNITTTIIIIIKYIKTTKYNNKNCKTKQFKEIKKK